ncbi:Bug family tripartite tricarboxylate transporter substrate binding protein [Noviherbaspirillum saxi]|uniref:Tripartite tricarboxylate transporter substrate binding protein n=1 Tax=Noviherbaspirillum saxi TaxID=2320863 RepID=A0A3A3FL06_9BURK|nr:tripartite tricarboxylate transporter substrate binding protein [Noviherbaspirillum saxi]RJF92035.1 tripartite tricarboxylate transporter substrate binding protein [Noviherbaspirillum saxi]
MNHASNTRRAVLAIVALALATPFLPAAAQTDKPVRMIVPNAPGSSVDALARTVGNPLSKAIGSPIVIENLPGAGGVPGTGQLVRAPKDGTALGMVSNNHVVNPSLYKSMPFDSIKDITPITIVAGSPFVLVAHPSVPAKDLKELIALAKAKPDDLTYGSSGNGTILHLAAEALQHEAGIKLKHIPYKGTGQMTTDLLGGQIQLGFLGVTGAAQHIKSGKLKAIGVSTTTPSSILPNVLPLSQQGVPNYSMQGWIALIGPAGMPPATVSKLYSDTKALLATKEVQDSLAAQGFSAVGSTPDVTAGLFQSEMVKYATLVKQSGMAID